MKRVSKMDAIRRASENGAVVFEYECGLHGLTLFNTKTRKCVACRNGEAPTRAARCTTADVLREENTRTRRAWLIAKGAEDPEFLSDQRARSINSSTRQRVRQWGRPDTAMPTGEALDQCLQAIKAAPEGAEIDHAVPLRGIHPITGEWVVSGLHVAHNLEPMTKRSNILKLHWFDPENPLEFQKPRNAFPGGQFHGEIGKIELMRYTVPTVLELWTKEEFRAAIVAGGNLAMEDTAI